MLELRLASGLPSGLVARADHGQLARIIGDGLVEPPVSPADRMVLTRRGRLLADTVVHALVS
jgi:oxygen-independent coproporphyrinogen-3 oxidase